MKNISELNEKNYREFYSMQELANILRRTVIVWSWGAHAWTKMSNKLLRFKVESHRHKGHIYIAVNGADYYDIFLTTTRGRIVKTFTDIDISTLIETIDDEIERIPEYVDTRTPNSPFKKLGKNGFI